MPVTPPTLVARDAIYLGMVKINHRARGYTYHYCLSDAGGFQSGANQLIALCEKLKYIIPVGSEIFDAICYQPDKNNFALSALTKSIPSFSTKIITPGTGDPDTGFVPNDYKTCLHMEMYTASWRGREFFRTPPDAYISDSLYVGPDIVTVQAGSPAPTFTTNTSTATGKVDGTFGERLYDYYYYVFNTFKKEWRWNFNTDGTVDQENIATSALTYIDFKRVTSHKMGRAYVP